VEAVLSQKVDGVERPIAFFSRVMNTTQRNYCTTRRELLAVICALQHFRHYLLGNKVVLRTDHHSLKWLQTPAGTRCHPIIGPDTEIVLSLAFETNRVHLGPTCLDVLAKATGPAEVS